MQRAAFACVAALTLSSSCGGTGESTDYDVSLSDSGKLALVVPRTDRSTIAGIEAAARRAAPRGCSATVAPVIYTIAADNRDAVLPASAAQRFAGRYPATLDC